MGNLEVKVLKDWQRRILAIAALLELAGCGQALAPLPQMNESGTEAGQLITNPLRNLVRGPSAKSSQLANGVLEVGDPAKSAPLATAAPSGSKIVRLAQSTNLRFKKAGVLEFLVELPPNSEISIPVGSKIDSSDYRISNGQITRNTTGFVTPLQVVSIPKGTKSARKLSELNHTPGGLFVAASVVTGLIEIRGNFSPLPLLQTKDDYRRYFTSEGRPRFQYRQTLLKKFGARLNHLTAAADPKKSRAIMLELKRVADRQMSTPKNLLMTNPSDAKRFSQEFEATGATPPMGAWSIAVTATAERHGFSNAPCAEFVSEEIREAYVRAGLKSSDDFNAAKGNELIWKKSASVIGLEKALTKAGWSPWSTSDFEPPTGAVVLNGTGESPGHAYLAAGANGRYIVDNGSPQGRDLGQTLARTIGMMYQGGVFFLPPGIRPNSCSSQTITVAKE